MLPDAGRKRRIGILLAAPVLACIAGMVTCIFPAS